MIQLENMSRYSDDLYDLTFMYKGKEIGIKRCVDFDSLETEIKNFCGHLYKVREIYQSVYYNSQLVVQVETTRYSKPKKQVTAADIRRAIVQCSEAHALLINKSEYDRGFQCGLEHATRLIDQMLNDAWRAAVEGVRSKTYTVKLTGRRRK